MYVHVGRPGLLHAKSRLCTAAAAYDCWLYLGPRLFFSCPIDCSQFPTWFADLWNYSIVPYMLEAVRDGVQVN